jgi:hypothetical protein
MRLVSVFDPVWRASPHLTTFKSTEAATHVPGEEQEGVPGIVIFGLNFRRCLGISIRISTKDEVVLCRLFLAACLWGQFRQQILLIQNGNLLLAIP